MGAARLESPHSPGHDHAGARAFVLWRVRRVPGKGVRATVRESIGEPNGPKLWIGDESTCLRPNVVLRAARNGRARSSRVSVKRGVATWSLAAIAEAAEPLVHGEPR